MVGWSNIKYCPFPIQQFLQIEIHQEIVRSWIKSMSQLWLHFEFDFVFFLVLFTFRNYNNVRLMNEGGGGVNSLFFTKTKSHSLREFMLFFCFLLLTNGLNLNVTHCNLSNQNVKNTNNLHKKNIQNPTAFYPQKTISSNSQ